MLSKTVRALPCLSRGAYLRNSQNKAFLKEGYSYTLRAFSSAPERIEPFLLADIGEGIAEVELMKWFVKEGEEIKAFDRLCEVQSDKATVEITSRYDGRVVSVHHEEGSIVPVGSALCGYQH